MHLTRTLADDSPNPVHKIAATLCGRDTQNLPFIISRTNFWPGALDSIPRTTWIGNSSGWIHAETAAIFRCTRTEGADLYVTDPLCPDCMKNVLTAGIRAVYIDIAGYAKPYAVRDGHTIIEMSHRMAHHAGVPVYMVDSTAGQITCLNDLRDDVIPSPAADHTPLGPIVSAGEERGFAAHVLHLRDDWSDQDFATACALTPAGQIAFLTVTPDIIPGHAGKPNMMVEGKHDFVQTSLMRLLLTARRLGLRLIMDSVTCANGPSSRDLVNFIGAGGRQIRILSAQKSRDAASRTALSLLETNKILAVQLG